MQNKVDIGDLAKDMVTGFTGVVIGCGEHFHNCDTLGLQPRELINGEPAKVVWFDAPQIELIEKGVVRVIPTQPSPFKFGDQVKDKISGYKGTVTGITTWLNGCTRLKIESGEITKDKVPVEEQYFAPTQLVLVETAPTEKKKEKPPGGPMKVPAPLKAPR